MLFSYAKLGVALVSILTFFLLLACQPPPVAAPPTEVPAATPDIEATVAAGVAAGIAAMSTGTPHPASTQAPAPALMPSPSPAVASTPASTGIPTGTPTFQPTEPSSSHSEGLKPQMANTSVQTDREILTNVFYATDGAKWDDSATWATERSLGDWDGVQTNDEGRVTALGIHIEFDPDDQPKGDILGEIHNLDRLQDLGLGLEGLKAEIPRELGYLSDLRSLYISGSHLHGEIPQGVLELEKLWDFTVEAEKTHVEASDALENLIVEAELVRIEAGAISGCLSDFVLNSRFRRATNFLVLQVGDNMSWTQVCTDIHQGDLDALREIYDEWGAHGSMSNWLTRLPVHEWGGVTIDRNGRVVELEFYLEKRDGPRPSDTIPDAIGRLTALQYLQMSSIGLKGEIPKSFANLTQLKLLDLGNNELTGEVPAFLSDLPHIRQMYLGDNLTGCLPEPPARPLEDKIRSNAPQGSDGTPPIYMGVPELGGVEYCP